MAALARCALEIPGRFGLSCFTVILLSAALCASPAHAFAQGYAAPAAEAVTTVSALTDLEAKAAQAEPRERCFLYTELLHEWTEVAGRSLAAGDTASAETAIQHADANAARLKEAINRDSKRLKNAELLMARSVHRLSDIMRVSTLEQHDSMQAVLRRISSVHDDLLAAVFAH